MSYILGADFARMGQDKTSFIIIEQSPDEHTPHKVVYIKEIAKNTMDEAIEYILFLHNKFNFKKIICDQTGLGAGPVDILRKKLNPPRKQNPANYKVQYDDYADIVIGLTFTIQTKMDIFSNLKVLMEQGKLKFPNHKTLIFQLKDFRYEKMESGHMKLHHSDGGHDDLVDALACAAHGLKTQEAEFFFG